MWESGTRVFDSHSTNWKGRWTAKIVNETEKNSNCVLNGPDDGISIALVMTPGRMGWCVWVREMATAADHWYSFYRRELNLCVPFRSCRFWSVFSVLKLTHRRASAFWKPFLFLFDSKERIEIRVIAPAIEKGTIERFRESIPPRLARRRQSEREREKLKNFMRWKCISSFHLRFHFPRISRCCTKNTIKCFIQNICFECAARTETGRSVEWYGTGGYKMWKESKSVK